VFLSDRVAPGQYMNLPIGDRIAAKLGRQLTFTTAMAGKCGTALWHIAAGQHNPWVVIKKMSHNLTVSLYHGECQCTQPALFGLQRGFSDACPGS
jgi:hypothetical protein